MADTPTDAYDQYARQYAQAGQLNKEQRYDEAVEMCKRMLNEPGLSDHHRMLVCICLADSTDDWEVAEEHRRQAEQVYSRCRLLFPTGSMDPEHEAAMMDIRKLLDELEASQREQAPSDTLPYESEAATLYAEGTIEEMANMEEARAEAEAEAEMEREEEEAADAIFDEMLATADAATPARVLFGVDTGAGSSKMEGVTSSVGYDDLATADPRKPLKDMRLRTEGDQAQAQAQSQAEEPSTDTPSLVRRPTMKLRDTWLPSSASRISDRARAHRFVPPKRLDEPK